MSVDFFLCRCSSRVKKSPDLDRLDFRVSNLVAQWAIEAGVAFEDLGFGVIGDPIILLPKCQLPRLTIFCSSATEYGGDLRWIML